MLLAEVSRGNCAVVEMCGARLHQNLLRITPISAPPDQPGTARAIPHDGGVSGVSEVWL